MCSSGWSVCALSDETIEKEFLGDASCRIALQGRHVVSLVPGSGHDHVM